MTNRSFLAPFLLYFATFMVCIGLCTIPSCSSVDCKDPKNASSLKCLPADTISCAGTEYQAVTSGKSLIDIALDVYHTIQDAIAKAASGDVVGAAETAVKDLIGKYGEPIVACVIRDQSGAAPPASSGSATTPGAPPSTGQLEPNVFSEIVKRHGWKFASAGGGK